MITDTDTRTMRGKHGWRRWMRNLSLGLAAVVLALTSTALVAGAAAKAKLKAHYPPTGQLVDVGGYRLHLTHMGEDRNGPTVVCKRA